MSIPHCLKDTCTRASFGVICWECVHLPSQDLFLPGLLLGPVEFERPPLELERLRESALLVAQVEDMQFPAAGRRLSPELHGQHRPVHSCLRNSIVLTQRENIWLNEHIVDPPRHFVHTTFKALCNVISMLGDDLTSPWQVSPVMVSLAGDNGPGSYQDAADVNFIKCCRDRDLRIYT